MRIGIDVKPIRSQNKQEKELVAVVVELFVDQMNILSIIADNKTVPPVKATMNQCASSLSDAEIAEVPREIIFNTSAQFKNNVVLPY